MRWPEGDRQQGEYTTHEAQTMRGRKDIEKAAARIRFQKNSCSDELSPGDHLADKEEEAQRCRPAPPVAESIFVVREEKPARTGQRKTAGNQDDRVEPEDA